LDSVLPKLIQGYGLFHQVQTFIILKELTNM